MFLDWVLDVRTVLLIKIRLLGRDILWLISQSKVAVQIETL